MNTGKDMKTSPSETVFFSIISTGKYVHTRQKTLKETWLSSTGNYIFASDIDNHDNALMSSRTDRTSAEEKQLNSLKYINENHADHQWYFFCDDDTYVDLKNLSFFLSRIEKDNPAIESFGRILSIETDPMNPCWSYMGNDFRYYSGGAGFCVKKSLLTKLAKMDFPAKTGFSDLSMGKMMSGIDLYDVNLFNSTNPYDLQHTQHVIEEAITYHYMSEKMMCDIYESRRK